MPEFPGKIRLMGDPFDAVKADIEVADGCIALIVSDHEIGEWPLDQVAIEVASEGFLMRVDGEEFVFATSRDAEFAEAVGVGSRQRPKARSKTRKTRLPRLGKKPTTAVEAPQLAMGSFWSWWTKIDWSDPKNRLLAGAVAAGVSMAVVARPVLAGLLLAGGMVSGVVAGAAIVDPLLASRLPIGLTNIRLVITALMSLMVGMLLIAF